MFDSKQKKSGDSIMNRRKKHIDNILFVKRLNLFRYFFEFSF